MARCGGCLLLRVAGGDVAGLSVVTMNRANKTPNQKEARREKDKQVKRMDK